MPTNKINHDNALFDAAMIRTSDQFNKAITNHEPGCDCGEILNAFVEVVNQIKEVNGPVKTSVILAEYAARKEDLYGTLAGTFTENMIAVLIDNTVEEVKEVFGI